MGRKTCNSREIRGVETVSVCCVIWRVCGVIIRAGKGLDAHLLRLLPAKAFRWLVTTGGFGSVQKRGRDR